jgi:nucleotide-binding universal stress UspA family protein
MKFKHALLAVDLSKSSDDLVHCMEDLEKLGIKKVTLMTAVSNPYPGGAEKFDRSPFESKLTSYSQNISDQGFEADFVLKVESSIYAPVIILKTARELEVDLLILGHRGHNRFSELFLGSVASEIIQRSVLPTLLLRVSDESDNKNVSICKNFTKRILVPTDFSDNADRVLKLFENVELRDSQVILLHIQSETNPAFEAEMKHRKDFLVNRGIKNVESLTLQGDVWESITEYADKNDVSLIAMGSQGRGYLSSLFIGSNSMRVARYTSKPLMLIPADR